MDDRAEFLELMRSARSSPRLLCAGFQRDLSAMLDGELGEDRTRRAVAHLEGCGSCAEFFQAIRLQVLAHRDLALPGSLARRLRRLRGDDLFDGLADAEIVRRLARALYELGKAYALLATDDKYLLRVAEEPVQIDAFEREEVAEVLHAAQQAQACAVPAEVLADHKEDHLAKSRRLLDEALRLKPKFAEARLYSGFVYQVQGRRDLAEQEYRAVFLHTDRLVNRAHAAIQLGMVYDFAGAHAEALRMYRWVVASGLVDRRPEFAFVLHNIAVEHLSLGDAASAVQMLRRILGSYQELWESSKTWLKSSPKLLHALEASDPEFCREAKLIEASYFTTGGHSQ